MITQIGVTERKSTQNQEGSKVKIFPVPFAFGGIKEDINIITNTTNKHSEEQIIEQTLKKGISAHKEGKLQEAEHLYRVILQSQPLNPVANHNLGLLTVAVNKTDAALPLFKTALAADPKTEQFWLSYIKALIKGERNEVAKQVIEQAKEQGINVERLNALQMQLKPADKEETHLNPTENELNNLFILYQNQKYDEVEC